MSDFLTGASEEEKLVVDQMSQHQRNVARELILACKGFSDESFVEALAVLLALETSRGIRLQRRVYEGEDVAVAVAAEFGEQ